jgi:hypothetical protein
VHGEFKVGKMVVQVYGCLEQFISGLKAEESVIYIEGEIEAEG